MNSKNLHKVFEHYIEKFDTLNFNELIEKYRQVMRIEASAVRQYENAVKAMVPYEEYLD